MKHAYLIMAHNEFELLQMLISMLDDARNDIYLHIDKKAKEFKPKMITTKYATLHVLTTRLDVRWGHFSQIKLEMLLFETAFKNGPYAYYHLLSGVDLPIKHQNYIHNFFTENNGNEFVGFWHSEDLTANWRVSSYFLLMQYEKSKHKFISILSSKIRNVFVKILPKRDLETRFKKGPNWVSISNNFCKYLINNKKWILKRFKYTKNGDEIFLQTILWNSSFKNKIYNLENAGISSLREIDWKRGNIASPYTWKSDDKTILQNSNKLFARKFSMKIDEDVIYWLKSHVENAK